MLVSKLIDEFYHIPTKLSYFEILKKVLVLAIK